MQLRGYQRALLVAVFALVLVGLSHELRPANAIANVVQAGAFGGQDEDRLEVHDDGLSLSLFGRTNKEQTRNKRRTYGERTRTWGKQ